MNLLLLKLFNYNFEGRLLVPRKDTMFITNINRLKIFEGGGISISSEKLENPKISCADINFALFKIRDFLRSSLNTGVWSVSLSIYFTLPPPKKIERAREERESGDVVRDTKL
jgi:hypothetical protein